MVLTSLRLQVLLHIEEKLFAYLHQALFREDNGKAVSDTASGVSFLLQNPLGVIK